MTMIGEKKNHKRCLNMKISVNIACEPFKINVESLFWDQVGGLVSRRFDVGPRLYMYIYFSRI